MEVPRIRLSLVSSTGPIDNDPAKPISENQTLLPERVDSAVSEELRADYQLYLGVRLIFIVITII